MPSPASSTPSASRPPATSRVILQCDDTDYCPERAGEFPFNAKGKAYGVKIADVDAILASTTARDEDSLNDALQAAEPLDRIYAPSEPAAYHNARLSATARGWTVLGSLAPFIADD